MQNIKFHGKEYPAVFSVRVAIHAAEKYGSVQAIFEGGEEAENLKKRVWLLHELLQSGKAYAEREYGEQVEDVPSYEELLDMVGFGELIDDLTLQLLTVITEDQKQKIEVEHKKKETNPGQ